MKKHLMALATTTVSSQEQVEYKISKYKFIGNLLLFNDIKLDSIFLLNASDLITFEMESASVALRIKCGWAFANYCHALCAKLSLPILYESLSDTKSIVAS